MNLNAITIDCFTELIQINIYCVYYKLLEALEVVTAKYYLTLLP